MEREECCRGYWKQPPQQRAQEEGGGSRTRGLGGVFEGGRVCTRSRRLRR